MRGPFLLLLLLGGGLGLWLLLDETPSPAGDGAGLVVGELDRRPATPDEGPEALDAGAQEATIGVFRPEHAQGAQVVDWAWVHGQRLRLPQGLAPVHGADVLDAIGRQFGRDLPVRFADRATLERLRAERREGPAPETVPYQDLCEWIRQAGFEVEETQRFLLVRPRRAP